MRSLRHLVCLIFLFALCGCSNAQVDTPIAPQKATESTLASTPLDEYIARDEPNFKWQKVEERAGGGNQLIVLQVTSQTWQGRDWTHRVEIIRPDKNDFPDTALVLASFGSAPESLVAQLLTKQLGATVINISGIPNQPLWGMREDDLIAHTFQKFLETGDTTWPLLLPMTKSVVKAMDAVQEYSRQNSDKPISKFVISGASKRGWTSWLVAAAEARAHPGRVIGIIPLVYNNLNIPKQMPYQLESWGKYSAQIADYTRRGLQEQLVTPRGQQLISIVDPYFYRERFTMPKLLVNGTNDPYWTPDATKFYLKDLPGSTSLYWAPNSGHDLGNDYPNVLRTAAAWFRLVASTVEIPSLTGFQSLEIHAHNAHYFTPISNHKIAKAVLWTTQSDTKDFRQAQWKRIERVSPASLPNDRKQSFIFAVPNGEKPNGANFKKYSAAFAMLEFGDGTSPPLSISTPVEVWETGKSDYPRHDVGTWRGRIPHRGTNNPNSNNPLSGP